jgi:hypothetical protein
MKKNDIITKVVIFLVIALVSLAIYLDPIKSQKSYSPYDSDSFSFLYSDDFLLNRTDSGEISFINIFPKESRESLEPKFIEITLMTITGEKDSLKEDLRQSYPELKNNQIKKIVKKGAEGYQFSSTASDEETINSYFKYNDKIVIAKFYKKYYSLSQPLVAINNSLYLKDYFNLINSIKFN